MDYSTWRYAYDLTNIRTASNERIKANYSFTKIAKDAEWLDKLNDKSFSLNLEKYREEQKDIKSTVKEIESLSKLSNPMNLETLPQDNNKYGDDKDKADRYKQWIDSRKSDIYLKEAVNVVDDMVSQKNLVYNK